MMTDAILEATSKSDLQAALRGLSAHYWQATSAYYITYDETRQTLSYRDQVWEPRADHQPGVCALTLRPVTDQSLGWPDVLGSQASYRMAIPIFTWGSLNGVLCLAFEDEPQELEGLSQVEKALGAIGEKVAHREKSLLFIGRCKELLVQAVEARGRKGHVERCSRLCTALANMLDCSAQVKSDLLDAAQYHDVGLLTFDEPHSARANAEHSMVGASLLQCHPELSNIAMLVESHHERYDGSGLPHGKSGDELSLEAWILALVEEFVEFWESSLEGFESKIRQFFKDSAKHHHPDVVDALCGLVDSGQLEELL